MKQSSRSSLPSRRQLLQAASASAAILGAACAVRQERKVKLEYGPVYPAPEPPGPDEPIRMGVIGTGGMGTGHCASITNLAKAGREKVQIVALADVCQTHLDNAYKVVTGNQPGVEVATYRYYQDLLKRPDIHAVLIATPEHSHAQCVIDAIRAGKDVYCEKPMTLRLFEALAVREVVLDSDRVFCVGTQHIMQPKYHEARKLLRQQAIGQLVWSQTSYCRNSKIGEWNYYQIDPKVVPGPLLDWEAWCRPRPVIPFDTKIFHRWRRYRDWSTGIVGDLLVHMMTPLFWTMELEAPRRVVAAGDHIVDLDMENHDQVMLTLEFDRPFKHQMVVAGSTANEVGLEVMVRGHKGTIYLGGASCRMRPERIFSEEVEGQDIQTEQVQDQDEMRLQWLRCIRTREKPMGDIELATRVMVAVDLATRSMWEGSAFWWDADRMRAERA